MQRARFEVWIADYIRLWRTPGTDGLGDLFTIGATYLVSPWAEPVRGLDAIARLWDEERVSADEPFAIQSELVAVDGATAVARLQVEYHATGDRWRDLWIIELDADGRCRAFEEWPIAPPRLNRQ
jgi:hypothetical protein